MHAFGTGHSEAFAMEIAGRAGGLIPTNKIALRDLVLRGSLTVDQLGGSSLERDPAIVEELWDISPVQPGDVFMIASNSGVNGSIVGFARSIKEHGHRLIAVTSLEHTMQVQPKHPSGQRLSDVADVVIDNLAPYGDATLTLSGGVPVGCGLLDHQRLHRPAAHHRRGGADRSHAVRPHRSTCRPTSPAATNTTPDSRSATRPDQARDLITGRYDPNPTSPTNRPTTHRDLEEQ